MLERIIRDNARVTTAMGPHNGLRHPWSRGLDDSQRRVPGVTNNLTDGTRRL
jgi:hypothetical protein